MNRFVGDIRYAARSLLKSPGFTAVAVLTLTLGIGANTAIFSVVNQLLLRPLPGAEGADRLVTVYTSDFSSGPYGASSYPDYRDYRGRATAFSGLAAFAYGLDVNFSTGGPTQRAAGALVSGNYFQVLGVDAALGRTLLPRDDDAAADRVAMISHSLWRQRFGSDAGVIGEAIRLNGNPFTIVGVLSSEFRGTAMGAAPDVWAPLSATGQLTGRFDILERRGSRWLGVVGRLAPGTTLEEASAQVRTIAAGLAATYPGTNLGTLQAPDEPRPMTLVPANEAMVGPSNRKTTVQIAWLLMAVVVLVLLIACENLANLLLARASGRRREIGVRLSIGAGRGHVVRQLLTESVLLALLGGAAGLLLAVWLADTVLAAGVAAAFPIPGAVPEVTLDGRVLAFTFLLSLAAGVIFGLAPALQASRTDLVATLKDAGSRMRGRARRIGLRNSLVVGQVALALLLLIGTGLFIGSLRNTLALDTGFTLDRALIASIDLGSRGFTESQGRAYLNALEERVESLPGVRGMTYAWFVPVDPAGGRRSIGVEGYEPRPGEDMEININFVGRDYFETMGIPLLAGRGFDERDHASSPAVVVVNEAFAERYWQDRNPVGRTIRPGGPEGPPFQVVGMVATSKYRSLREEPLPYVYVPLAQEYRSSINLVVSTAVEPTRILPALRAEAARIDAAVPLFEMRTLREHLGALVSTERTITGLVTGFGLLALLLAALGIYGLMSFLATQRTHEIGIRMALGARANDMLGLVLRNGLALTAIGVVLGAGAAVLFTRLVSGFLFGVSPTDPLVYALTALVLAAAAALATYIPTRRAARVDPMVALRNE